MPARHDATCLIHFVGPSLQDRGQDGLVQICGERGDVEGKADLTAHGVNVAHRVSGGYGPKRIGVVHDGREEVERLDDSLALADEVDSRVVAGRETDY